MRLSYIGIGLHYMGIQKKILFLGLGLLLFFFVVIFFTFSGEESEREKKKNRSKQLSSLLLGGGSQKNGQNPLGIRGEDSESIFDSDYYKAGGMRYEEDGSGTPLASAGEIPINPQTGKPYTVEAMETFDELRDMFPDNDLIPRRMTPEEKAKQDQLTASIQKATQGVFGGSPKAEDLSLYYGNVQKQGKDRLEIIEYLINSQGGEDPEMDKKFQEILTNIKTQNEQMEKEMKGAYERAGLQPPN